jgi:hypothetical protein
VGASLLAIAVCHSMIALADSPHREQARSYIVLWWVRNSVLHAKPL